MKSKACVKGSKFRTEVSIAILCLLLSACGSSSSTYTNPSSAIAPTDGTSTSTSGSSSGNGSTTGTTGGGNSSSGSTTGSTGTGSTSSGSTTGSSSGGTTGSSGSGSTSSGTGTGGTSSGSGTGGGTTGSGGSSGPTATYTIGGIVTGLNSSGLELQDNGGDNLSIAADGTFVFPTALLTGAAYSVRVLKQPSIQVCKVSGASGNVATANITNVLVVCVNSFAALPAGLQVPRSSETATLLPNGQILVTGGQDASGNILSSAELFDPVAQAFTLLPVTMTMARTGHTATLLPNGLVLLAGGFGGTSTNTVAALATAEFYDPTAQTFTRLAGPSASMTTPRFEHAATLLPNGQVLLTGGRSYLSNPSGSIFNSAEVFDPVARTFTALPAAMTTPRYGHTIALLPNGSVLVAGGFSSTGTTPGATNSAEFYNPATGNFTRNSTTMTTARMGHTATVLPNGLVLLAGGQNGSVAAFGSAELYSSVTNTFALLTATMATARTNHAAAVLPNGLVLLMGGIGTSGTLGSAEQYDPVAQNNASETFAALAAAMTTTRSGHTATLLPNGSVLLAGGQDSSGTILQSAEIFSSVTQQFTTLAANMTVPRTGHTATLLSSGQVLLTGGTPSGGTSVASAELFNPATNTFSSLSSTMTTARSGHTATLLPNGEVLLAGGVGSSGATLQSAELYNIESNSFTLTGSMTTPRTNHTATLLANGLVLLTGGFGASGSTGAPMNSWESFHSGANTFSAVNSVMSTARAGHTATLLPNGLVLFAGGTGVVNGSSAVLNSAELYNSTLDSVNYLGNSMTTSRARHTGTLLRNGLVLVTGGVNGVGASAAVLATAEKFVP